jgi:hydrogenase/urease accessory protein HupE
MTGGTARVLVVILLALAAGRAGAHEITMAEMQLRQISPTEFLWQWTASEKGATRDGLRPLWPEGCTPDENILRCGAGGLRGTLAMEGVGERYSAAIVKVYWLDGQTRVYTLTSGQPVVRLWGSADDQRGLGAIVRAYALLGVEHILSGLDHLLFVVGLLFLVGFNRRLFWTITAFTVAHSLTLALSALGWLTLRSPPVEAAIALSIVLVAAEALHDRSTLSRRWPAVVAFLFGLVHGLGFAGALAEIGLPQQHLLMALLSFNLGVEAGQLLVVALAYATYRLLAGRPVFVLARVPALYVIGSIAAYWSVSRLAGLAA